MAVLKDIGELGISDSREGGRDYVLRPSFEAMSRLGEPEEIVRLYAEINGSDVQRVFYDCDEAFGGVPDWMLPVINNLSDKILSASMLVLQACCEEDLTRAIGEWSEIEGKIMYLPGIMPKEDIVTLAKELMLHGIIGNAKVRRLQRHEAQETTTEFNAAEYIAAAQTHFNIGLREASQLTMTAFQLLLAAKYPDQKGFTRDEYDAIANEYLARQATRREKAKAIRQASAAES
ncbi:MULTISPECIES: DUF6246 family protein [Klebsiella]|jgi:hypothetical protein|uniref:Uncharacterized protein n=1 Tax=Siphoviridae sp. ctUyy2 TaxID=2827574 RepID=A0A8S5LN04_9CAUD|nr:MULTISPECIES: DUF6246 family protein [Klebsiella]DAD71243.1 MAG TPA: hypothetical protein [Siphoviridae sp. ctUyy2]MCJ7325475.1 DUF6246 family protein [Klebsiella quasipneumoniae]OYE75664.1 hypothetical protein CI627_06135 [Klebsiella pneumoniae subsp. pneumoniae]OYE82931.1 hypothetical protein CI629_20610 [Klebsiella pneumoniae subsp. pneumoniae]OYE95150.1 hypothetical protein CI628_15630 [Klebsiella pneumoniae subsp. pneumoniae]